MDVFEYLKDGSWISGWVSLILAVAAIVIPFYNESRTRPKLQKDITIYKAWKEEGDPAGLEFCRRSINERMEKFYSPKHIPITIKVWFVATCIVLFVYVAVIAVDVNQGLEINPLWIITAIIYLITLIFLCGTIREKLQQSKGEQASAVDVIRTHADLMRLKRVAVELKKREAGDGEVMNQIDDVFQRISRCFDELYEIAEGTEEVDAKYLRDQEACQWPQKLR